jgi:hypothetical protein
MKLSILCLLVVIMLPLWPSAMAPATVDMTPVIEAIERAWDDIYAQIETLREIEEAAL